MIPVLLNLEPEVVRFYSHIAAISGRSLEQVLTDALFKLAGELSLEALRKPDGFYKRDCNSP